MINRRKTARVPLCLLILIPTVLGMSGLREPTIFLIGDSTMADKPLIGNPERGWGQVFPLFFREGIRVENHARNGRSTRSFINEGLWETVRRSLQPGDYVLIQFGHNDAKKSDTTRYAEAHTEYRSNLMRFVRETRTQGAFPILITPVVRRRFTPAGEFFDVHGDYPDVVRQVGKEEGVPCLDLHRSSMDLLKKLGSKGSEQLFLRIEPGVYSTLPTGKTDDTHFCWRGAAEIASLVVNEIHDKVAPLAAYLRDNAPAPFVGSAKIVLLDCYYNNEWRTDSTGRRVRYHYVWHDSTNSGFSQLAVIISHTGADIDTLCGEPTEIALSRASVYMIVDPDTPKETDNPKYIEQQAIDTIVRWVTGGGVLVLMGNDKGNAEFEHLNRLAARFGMHFNEDSRNRVVGDRFEDGTFARFPDHPLFRGVARIYIKELSTLSVREPATAVLSEGGDVIMAFARMGKGAVFAVGDPWFYNEYMDTRKLPEGYDNRKAAANLFEWLLSNFEAKN